MAEQRGPSRVEKLREAMGQKAPEKVRAEALRGAGEQFKLAQQAYSRAESALAERVNEAVADGVPVHQIALDAGVPRAAINDLITTRAGAER
ncbi:hypothetical protein [Actinomycetospora atypica]|uniref:Uncharacterized protein n=1 Tax=Actinomycetospora atypica TaxID=1290095 RepID=A0ABV9YGF8_9PSEU